MNEPVSFNDIGKHLATLTDFVSGVVDRFSEEEWREPCAPGKWTRLEVLGHLVDSAAHNHQRFARALYQPSITAPGYDAGPQVRAQHYAEAPVAAIVDAWRAQNRLLSFVLAQIPAEKEQTPCSIGTLAPMTLRELALDYLRHLQHHLEQIFAGRKGMDGRIAPAIT